MKKKELYIPLNVPEQKDYVSGFGVKELGITGAAFFAAVLLAVFISLVFGSMFYAFMAAGTLMAVTIMLVIRDRYNESVIDKLRFIKRYSRAQKQYEYVYSNIYEGRRGK